MDFDTESRKNQQAKPLNASFFDARPPIFHYPYRYNFGVTVPGIFVPFPSYAMYPNAAVEQQVPPGFRTSFPRGVREDWTENETRGTASSPIQNLNFNANSELDFNLASQVETRALYAAPRQQDWPYETAAYHWSSNELGLPQANAVAHISDSYPHDSTTKQQIWYGESAAHDNIPNSFEFAWREPTAHNPFINGFDQNASTNLLPSSGATEINLFSDNGNFDTQPNSISSSTEPNFLLASFQASTSTYCTSSPLEKGSTHAAPSYIPETSFSSTSTSAPTSPTSLPPSPANAPSQNSTRHPCLHPHCQSTFARQGDLRRHARIHSPEYHRNYHCWEPGCDRNGRKGFTRRDKLIDHARRAHRVEEDGSEFRVSSGREDGGGN